MNGKDTFGMQKPSKFNVPGWNELAKELNARYREAVSHWNIAGHCSQSMLSKLRSGEFNDFWKEIKALNPKKESLPLTVGGTSGGSNIANVCKDPFSAIANSVGSTDNRDQVTNALGTVPGHNDGTEK